MTRLMLVNFYRAFNEPAVPPIPPVPPAPPAPPVPASPPAAKTFTEADVARMMEEHRKTLQARNAELTAQLEEQKKNTNLTAEQKDALEARIDALSKEHLTKEQQQLTEFDKLKKKYDTDTKALTEDRQKWHNSFQDLMINHAFTEAAIKNHAHSPEQITMMFKSQAKVVEAVDADGRPIGGFTVKMPVTKIDPKTKLPVILELGLVDAIAVIRENESYGNLFVDTSRGGVGGSGNRGGGAGGVGDSGPPPNDPGEYRKWRTKNKL